MALPACYWELQKIHTKRAWTKLLILEGIFVGALYISTTSCNSYWSTNFYVFIGY